MIYVTVLCIASTDIIMCKYLIRCIYVCIKHIYIIILISHCVVIQ